MLSCWECCFLSESVVTVIPTIVGFISGGVIGAVIGSVWNVKPEAPLTGIIGGAAVGALVGAAIGDAVQWRSWKPGPDEARKLLIARSNEPPFSPTGRVSRRTLMFLAMFTVLNLIQRGCSGG